MNDDYYGLPPALVFEEFFKSERDNTERERDETGEAEEQSTS
jgi:hypothetical protein